MHLPSRPSNFTVHAVKICIRQKVADMGTSMELTSAQHFLTCCSWSTHIWYLAKAHLYLPRQPAELSLEEGQAYQGISDMVQQESGRSVQQLQQSRRKFMIRNCSGLESTNRQSCSVGERLCATSELLFAPTYVGF
jgi:hypothetical protein